MIFYHIFCYRKGKSGRVRLQAFKLTGFVQFVTKKETLSDARNFALYNVRLQSLQRSLNPRAFRGFRLHLIKLQKRIYNTKIRN